MNNNGPFMTPEDLLARLDAMGIAYALHRHAPIFTVAEGAAIERNIEGGHCRNLFLKDKKGRMILVTALNETAIDLKTLPDKTGMGRLSFGSPERLWTYLGVRPGSVCPFAAVNDTDRQVTVYLDRKMFDHDIVCVHPLINSMTVGVSPHDLTRFLKACHHDPVIIDL